jgi:hypothetical protein
MLPASRWPAGVSNKISSSRGAKGDAAIQSVLLVKRHWVATLVLATTAKKDFKLSVSFAIKPNLRRFFTHAQLNHFCLDGSVL